MNRIITSIKNAKPEVLKEIAIQYPKGVDEDDLVSLPTVNGTNIRVLEVEIGDNLYLIKLESESQIKMFQSKETEEDDEDEDEDDNNDDIDSDLDEDDIDFDEDSSDDDD